MEKETVSKKLMISCREAGLLTTIKEADGLSFYQNIQLGFHNMLCKVCKLWGEQSAQLNKLIKKAFSTQKHKMPEEKKEQISKTLEELHS